MCLSDVYTVSANNDVEPVATKVSNIKSNAGTITLVDIFGDETTLIGEIDNVDLLENKIYIRSMN